jgi:hypothetical protein
MVLVRNNYRDLGGAWVIGDRVVRYTNESLSIECAKSARPIPTFDHLVNELVEMNGIQREEAVVVIAIREALIKCHNGAGIVGAEAAQKNDPAVSQLTCSGEFQGLTTHRFSS